jgi:hypothetical protein
MVLKLVGFCLLLVIVLATASGGGCPAVEGTNFLFKPQ